MRGQARVEFILSIVAFAIIVFYISMQINNSFIGIYTDARLDMLKAKAINTITFLVEDSGDPENWEKLSDPTKANRTGLAYQKQPYNLSSEKIFVLNKTRDSYGRCLLLENFSLGSYRLKIYNSTNEMLFCGYPSIAEITISLTKSVFIENQHGNITLEIW